MKIYDISMTIEEGMQVYKNREEKRPRIIVERDFKSGSTYESRLEFNLHTGSHIDAPLHMLENGETIASYALERLITPCKVFDFRGFKKISDEELKTKEIKENDFILFKTDNSFKEEFDFEFTYLTESGAFYLKEKKISGVGIDALGIERDQANHGTHKTLLGEGIIILEGLNLNKVLEGNYLLIALPLKIANVEAAPVRAVLLDDF